MCSRSRHRTRTARHRHFACTKRRHSTCSSYKHRPQVYMRPLEAQQARGSRQATWQRVLHLSAAVTVKLRLPHRVQRAGQPLGHHCRPTSSVDLATKRSRPLSPIAAAVRCRDSRTWTTGRRVRRDRNRPARTNNLRCLRYTRHCSRSGARRCPRCKPTAATRRAKTGIACRAS